MESKDKDKFEELIKKHKLPSFNELDKEFEISTIDKKEFPLREIRRKIAEKIDLYITLFESVLQVEPTIKTLNEIGAFSESEKENLYKLFRKFMVIDRSSIETSIDEDDEKTAEFIKTVFDQWKDLKKELLPIIKKLKESWMQEKDIKEILRYVG